MTEEQKRYIVDHWNEMSCEKLRKQFNEKFGMSYKVTAFHYHTKRLGLSKHIEHQYTAEQDAFLQDNASLMTRRELVQAFNDKFSAQVKEGAIEQRCFLRGWKPKTDGKFKTGGVPWQKTKGGRDEYVAKLKGGNSKSFRKGHVPANRREIGSIRAGKKQVEIKTENGWKSRLTWLWEQEFGSIPKGYKVISVNGDKYTEDINSLRLISNHTLTVLMSNRWLGKGEEIMDTGIAYSKLKGALVEAEKKEA